MALWDSSGGDYLTRRSQWQMRDKPGSGLSISGPLAINKSTMHSTRPAAPVVAEGMPSIDETESLYGKMSDAMSAAGWELYHGCRTAPYEGAPSMSDGKKAWAEELESKADCKARGGLWSAVQDRCVLPTEQATNVPPLTPRDRQVGGDHYKKAAMQPIEFIQANGLTFCEGSAVKYITRHRLKGGKADLEKAIHYLEMEIEHSYGS